MFNAADLAMLIAVLGCPFAAGMVAYSEKAGANTVFFVAGGFAFGATVGLLVNKIAYGLLKPNSQDPKASPGFISTVAFSLFPLLMSLASVGAAMWLTDMLVHRFK
jgi:hypothetical protein